MSTEAPRRPRELSEADWAAWPKCAVPACQNKCCLRLKSKYCWPHTPGAMGAAAGEPIREVLAAELP